MKEYGGYISLEAYGREYYGSVPGGEVLRFNAARYAIIEAFKDGGYDKMWVPVYTCQSVIEAIERAEICFEYYNITEDFMPITPQIESEDCILITNYFGIQSEMFYKKVLSRYKNIIFDNTQSFYTKPILQKGIYNVYSPRKFFGVSDGAYLITDKFNLKEAYEIDESSERMGFLLKAVENGTNAAYQGYLASEDDLSDSKVKEMSIITKTLLSNVDYEGTKRRRSDNFRFLVKQLRDINELNVDDMDIVPMVYPLLLEKNGPYFREYLVKNKVYIPQWWKWVLSNPLANGWECKLSNYLYPIPIDQRYFIEDMKEIVQIIRLFV